MNSTKSGGDTMSFFKGRRQAQIKSDVWLSQKILGPIIILHTEVP